MVFMKMRSGEEYQLITDYEREVVDLLEDGNTFMTVEVYGDVGGIKKNHWRVIQKSNIESFGFR